MDKLIDTAADGHRALDTSQQSPVVLDIAQPVSGFVSKESPVLVKGKASVNATVEVAGKEVIVDKLGMFSSLVDLALGKNSIAVTARRGSMSKTAECAVEYHPQLTMNVANIIDNMEISSGDITIDVEVNDGARFSVNGRENQTKVSLSPGKNVIAVRAWDQWNTVMEKSFAVNYTRTTGFTLTVATPKDQSTVRQPMIPVSGSTTPGAKVTVNGTPVTVTASGFFTYSIPIPDEVQDYAVRVVARLGDDEASEERSVSYSPPRAPLSLLVMTPVNGQVIRQNQIHVTGKTVPRARINVNNRLVTVSAQGTFTCDVMLTERDIGDYTIDIAAADDSFDITKLVNVKIDPASPQINTSFPRLSIPMLEGVKVTKIQRLPVSVTDKTPDDQISLVIQNNGAREEMSFVPGDQQYFNLEDGKNTYVITAYDLAKNPSNVIHGSIYYLPGRFTVDLIEPSSDNVRIDDLPPMPRLSSTDKWKGPKMAVEIEVDDGIRNVPETIRDVRLKDDRGNSFQMLDRGNYRYSIDIPVNRGQTRYTVVVTDIAENMGGNKTFNVNIR
jgi:hypothetical protein